MSQATFSGTPTLLAVDDQQDDLPLIRLALEQQKIRVNLKTALGGQAALDAVSEAVPALLLLEVNMPELSGHDVLKAILACESLSNIPVIMFTTSGAQIDVQAAFDNRANAYLQKPGSFDDMEDLFARMLTHWFGDTLLPTSVA